MSNPNQSNRRRQQYLQEFGENLDGSTQDVSNQSSYGLLREMEMGTSSGATTSRDPKNLSRSETENRKDVHDRAEVAATASASHHFVDTDIQSDAADQEKSDTVKQFDKMVLDITWNMRHDRNVQQQQQEKTMNDPVLLPKINQLSTATTAGTADHKEPLVQNIRADIEKIPDYLTKHNPSFKQMIHRVHSTIKTTATIIDHTNNKECIRRIALFIYKMMILQTYHLQWTAYLKSGLGQLIIPPHGEQLLYRTNIPIWPKDLKILLITLTHTTKENENEIYCNFVNEQLYALEHRLKDYQYQFNIETNHVHGYTSHIQKIIETYIEQHLRSFRMKMEHQIELIHCDYHIRVLKLEYLRHNPNQFQEQLLKEVCQSKYEQETSEQEYHCLRQQINYYNTASNQSFECSPLGQSTTILLDSIQNMDIRQQLLQQYKAIAEQSRDELFQVYMKSSEEERKKHSMEHEENIKKMWSVHHRPREKNQTISRIMIQLIDQRCQKISERIQCIYQFKVQSILP